MLTDWQPKGEKHANRSCGDHGNLPLVLYGLQAASVMRRWMLLAPKKSSF